MRDQSPAIYHRLIALWAICEAFGGGVLHAFKIPFTGLFVNSLAVLCITLIGYHYRKPGAIIKATIVVAVFKLMLSPHSPPTAYVAVFFQGMLGQLLFASTSMFTLRAITLAVLSLVESSIQRLLILLIVYGNEFWSAVDEYLARLTGNAVEYVELLAITYISIHAIAGIFTGIFSARLARVKLDPGLLLSPGKSNALELNARPRLKRIKYLFFLAWIFMLFIYIDSLVRPYNSVLELHYAVLIIIRAATILLTWWLLLAPFIKRILRTFIKTQEKRNRHLVIQVNELLPEVLYIFKQSWRTALTRTKGNRPVYFLKMVVTNILYTQKNKE